MPRPDVEKLLEKAEKLKDELVKKGWTKQDFAKALFEGPTSKQQADEAEAEQAVNLSEYGDWDF
jgi:polyhydroxyalkanoate synthesis regulator phasin